MSLDNEDVQPHDKEKGGGLGAFFKSTSDNKDTGKHCHHWDESSRGGYSTVSKMFRAKVRRSHKQKQRETECQQDSYGHLQEHDEASNSSKRYFDKLDGLVHRQHERTARRELTDSLSDEQCVQSRGALSHSTGGHLQRTNDNHSTATTANKPSSTSASSKSQTTTGKSLHRSSAPSKSSSLSFSSHQHASTVTGPSNRSLATNVSNASTSSSTSTQRHSNHNGHSSFKERSRSRSRAESRPRSSTVTDQHLSPHRSIRGTGPSKSSSMRKPVSSQSSSSNSDSNRRRRTNSSSDITRDAKQRGSNDSIGKHLSTVKEMKNTSDESAAAFSNRDPLQFAPGSAPISLECSPAKFLSEPGTARPAIQFLPSNNAKPLLFLTVAENLQVEGKSDSGHNVAPKQHNTTSNLQSKSSLKHGSGTLRSAKDTKTQNSTSHSHPSREMDRDRSNCRGIQSGSSRRRPGGEQPHQHQHGESSSRPCSRQSSIGADHSKSASKFSSEFDDSGSDSNLTQHDEDGGFGSSNHFLINNCFSSLSSESFPGEDNAHESKPATYRSSNNSTSQHLRQPSNGKIPAPRDVSVGKEASGSHRRSSGGKSIHGEATAAVEGTIIRRRLSEKKSISDPRHYINGSTISSSEGAEASSKLTKTTEKGRGGSFHARSDSHNSHSRHISSIQRKAGHLFLQSNSLERDLAANGKGNVSQMTTTTTTSKSISSYINADNGMIGRKEEELDCVDGNGGGDGDGDGDDDDDDGATFAEPNGLTHKLKTSHLRRLIEPPRRVVRCASHSSYSSTVGSLSSRDDSIHLRALRKPMRTESQHSACSWRPPHSRKSGDHSSSCAEDESFAIEMNHRTKKTDSAPKTPRRRGSSTASGLSYTSSYTKASRRHSQESSVCQDDLDFSEARIEEEAEESSSNPTDLTDYGQEEDVFTCFSWSTAKQDASAIERERKRMRDSIRGTPFYQAYRSSGIAQSEIAT